MTLRFDPQAVRTYAARLSEALAYVEAAKGYVKANGNFSTNESGLIGYIFPHHRSYMDALNQMLAHLAKITDASESSMQGIAGTYERTDKRSAQAVDASYPAVVRPPISHEAQERKYPEPPIYRW